MEVGRTTGGDRGRIQEEEDRLGRAAQKEVWRIMEADKEMKMGNSRYERDFQW